MNPVIATALADDLVLMDKSTAIELGRWPNAQEFVDDIKGTSSTAKVQVYTDSELMDWSHDSHYQALVEALRGSEEYLCGFFLGQPAGEGLEFCQHVSCAANQAFIAAAYVVRDGWWVDDVDSDPAECMRCGQSVEKESDQ